MPGIFYYTFIFMELDKSFISPFFILTKCAQIITKGLKKELAIQGSTHNMAYKRVFYLS